MLKPSLNVVKEDGDQYIFNVYFSFSSQNTLVRSTLNSYVIYFSLSYTLVLECYEM